MNLHVVSVLDIMFMLCCAHWWALWSAVFLQFHFPWSSSATMSDEDLERREWRDRLNMSIVGTKGLQNRSGENNCFLNSAVQVCWRCRCCYLMVFTVTTGCTCIDAYVCRELWMYTDPTTRRKSWLIVKKCWFSKTNKVDLAWTHCENWQLHCSRQALQWMPKATVEEHNQGTPGREVLRKKCGQQVTSTSGRR